MPDDPIVYGVEVELLEEGPLKVYGVELEFAPYEDPGDPALIATPVVG